ncbi:MAG: ABC transporter ATP-binding protein, partial [Alphaproteobacteria bacterium]
EPMTSLNPVLSIGRQVTDAIRAHRAMARSAAQARAIELLQLVEIPDPKRRLREYPHQLSGGMRQRVMIAMALGAQPELLIADEPTTALDATIQAQILALLTGLKNRLGLAILFITHNLGLVAEYADRVAVMYAGRIVEEGPVRDVLAAPAHPYTRGLLGARPHARRAGEPRQRLVEIPGQVPQPAALPRGCPFAPRCPNAITGCGAAEPPLEERGPNRRRVACIRIGEA